MSFFDLGFAFLFVPIVVFLYMIFPKKVKPFILLIASLLLVFLVSNFLIIFLILSIISIYLAGKKLKSIDEEKKLELEKKEIDKKIIKEKYKKKKKRVLILVILFNLLFLFIFKYLNFFTININNILNIFKCSETLPIIKLVAPIGISYYTLKAISYVVDVYQGKIEADNNFVRLALYLSYFPTILEGPISKYEEVANNIYEPHKVTYKSFCFGYQRILFGFFKKMLIADRLNLVVRQVFSNYNSFNGLSILIAISSYTMLLYMEFSGTMDVVIGTSDIFNINIPENFKQPFFSKNITDFWSRWHISLGHFFKDYIFYPVSLSKPLKKVTLSLRKKLNPHYSSLIAGGIALFCVWFLNGLWHGAGYTYLLFGMYHFLLIFAGNLFEPFIQKVCTKLKIDRGSKTYYGFQIVKTALLVFIGELFFRAESVTDAFNMLRRLFTRLFIIGKDELYYLGLDKFDILVVVIGLITVLVVSILKERNINIREEISKRNICIRWIIYYILILSIIILGAYGPSYSPVDPIYADF